jgi:orotate phosphoribosyltransferase
MLTRSLRELDLLIVKNLHRVRKIPFDVVVHLPRSGTIPASLIATYLKKPFASVEEYLAGIIYTRKSEYRDFERILLVDDSIRTGKQMQAAIDRIKAMKPNCTIYTLAVFSTKVERKLHPTLILSEHPELLYIYPWFMWKTKHISQCAVDMDGVLCRDCEPHEDDDGQEYEKFLELADVKFHTEFTIGAIVTSRLEKYRPQTEAWLKRHGFKYDQLLMGKWATKQERKGLAAAWKAKMYIHLNKQLFIESSEREAKEIARITGKPVWCIDTQEAY